MQLTQFTDYSLRALMFLAKRKDTLATIQDVSDYYGVSKNHMVKVIHNLVRLEYVVSIRGKGGGIKLRRPPHEINLRTLIQELEPNLQLVECFDAKHNQCHISDHCGLKPILGNALEAFLVSLEGYSLADTLPKCMV